MISLENGFCVRSKTATVVGARFALAQPLAPSQIQNARDKAHYTKVHKFREPEKDNAERENLNT